MDPSEYDVNTSHRDLSRSQSQGPTVYFQFSIMGAKGTALVTGAAQGIGRSIALRLAGDGFAVACNDVVSKKEELEAVVGEIHLKGRKGLVVVGDVSVEDDVKEMVRQVVKELDGLDVVSSSRWFP